MRRKHMGGLITLPPFRKPVGSLGLKRVDRFAQEQSVGFVKTRQNLLGFNHYCKNCIGSTTGPDPHPKPSDLFRSDQPRMLDRSGNESRKQRMRIKRFRLQFRVELNANKPWVIRAFDNFRQQPVR